MPTFFAVFLIGFGIVGVCNFVTLRVTDRFFNALFSKYPDLRESFPRPSLFTQYGPIFPSKMSYLNAKQFNKLPEPELRELGWKALHFLNVYKAVFFAFFCGFALYAFVS